MRRAAEKMLQQYGVFLCLRMLFSATAQARNKTWHALLVLAVGIAELGDQAAFFKECSDPKIQDDVGGPGQPANRHVWSGEKINRSDDIERVPDKTEQPFDI